MKNFKLAVVGATGVVGRAALKVLEEKKLPISEYTLFASKRSTGSKIQFLGKEYIVKELTENSFDEGFDFAIFSAGASTAKKYAPIAAEHGCIVVDNSSAFRMDKDIPLIADARFTEIDYGPDEGKTEDEVIARIGQEALDAWNANAIVPNGWNVSVDGIIQAWKDFAHEVEQNYRDKTVLVVSSNGIIRFAPYLTGNFEEFCNQFNIKVGTGSVCILEKEDGDKFWTVKEWGTKPKDKLVDKTAPLASAAVHA